MPDDMVERLRDDARGGYAYHELSDEAADEIERLRKALEPFALNAGAVSLSKALGHISREHLLAARDALEKDASNAG